MPSNVRKNCGSEIMTLQYTGAYSKKSAVPIAGMAVTGIRSILASDGKSATQDSHLKQQNVEYGPIWNKHHLNRWFEATCEDEKMFVYNVRQFTRKGHISL